MDIALITDIHGNNSALNAVLKELNERRNIAHIYCLGDMMAIGPDTNEVLDTLFSRNDVTMITGNHDEAVLALLKGEKHPKSHAHVKNHHRWIAERMDPDFIPFLEKLPRTHEEKLYNQTLYFTHYHIEESKQKIPISQDPFSPIVKPLNLISSDFSIKQRLT